MAHYEPGIAQLIATERRDLRARDVLFPDQFRRSFFSKRKAPAWSRWRRWLYRAWAAAI